MFKDYARLYDLCNADKEYAKEAEYLSKLIREHRPEAKSILELGSGTGTHAHLLTQAGFRLLGVERSEEMAAIAKDKFGQTGAKAEFACADIREFRDDRKFDVVTSLFHVMSYQTTEADFISALRTARHHLNRGGIFIFDVWYGPAVLANTPQVRVKRVADKKLKIVRIAEPEHDVNENTVTVNYTLQVQELETGGTHEILESHAVRYYFLPELRAMLKMADFELIDSHGWLDKSPLSEKTWGACLVAEAQ